MVDQFGRWYPDYPGQQPYMDPQYLRSAGQVQHPAQQPVPQMSPLPNVSSSPQPAPQMMTPPTIHAEIIQIDDESTVDRWPVNAGASQMFITKAEDKIIIKTMGPNGPLPLDVFDKRPPAPPEPVFDPSVYVRRDEVEGLIAAAVAAVQPTKRAAKKEEAET